MTLHLIRTIRHNPEAAGKQRRGRETCVL